MELSFRAWLLPVGISLLSGWLAWQIGPELPPAKAVRSSDESWSLSRPVVPDLTKPYEFLISSSIWGNVEVSKKQEEEGDPAWRFLAVLSNGNEKYVLIDVEQQPNRQLKVGDQLPGGAKILDIRQGSLCVLVNGKKRVLPIYPRDRQIL